ncbi:MAG: rhamnosyl/mannosyltransferase [Candidatus Azotimanducaceae bacterium]
MQVVTSKLDFEIASCGFSFSGMREFRRQLEWADIVHYHFPWPFADMLHFASNVKIPSVVTYHADIMKQKYLMVLYAPLMQRFLDNVDCIVATSPNYVDSSQYLRPRVAATKMVPLGIAEESYPEVDEETLEQVRGKYGENFFLFVGVLRYYKGLDVLLDAAIAGGFKVVIAGTGPESLRLNKKYQLDDFPEIRFAGYVSEKEKMALYTLCTAVVLPSFNRAEAFGVTLLEGAMMSKPLISANPESGSSYVNIDGHTGLVAEPDSVESLKMAMQRFVDDPALAVALGHNARKRYEEKFKGSDMVQGYMDIYTELVPERT